MPDPIRPWDCAWHYPGDEECFDADGRTAQELDALMEAGGPITADADASGAAWVRAWQGTDA